MRSPRVAVTLIELIVVITVLGIAVFSLVSILAAVSERAHNAEHIATAAFHAEEVMEQLRSKNFTAIYAMSNSSRDGYQRNITIVNCSLNTTSNTWEANSTSTAFKMLTVDVTLGGRLRANLTTVVGP